MSDLNDAFDSALKEAMITGQSAVKVEPDCTTRHVPVEEFYVSGNQYPTREVVFTKPMSYWTARDALLLAISRGDDEAIEYFLVNYPEMARNLVGMAKKSSVN